MSSPNEPNFIERSEPNSGMILWRHFLCAEDGKSAKCKLCSRVFKLTRGYTIGLHSHLYSFHRNVTFNMDLENFVQPSISGMTKSISITDSNSQSALSSRASKRRKLNDHYKPMESIETVVARMVVLDGLCFRFFSESKDLRRLFHSCGYNLPQTPVAISKLIYKKADDARAELRKYITELKQTGHKFTLSLEEWLSDRNKRYVNVNLYHKSSCKILGPVDISDPILSVAAFTSISNHLRTFNVSIPEDIISLTTDGSEYMKKLGIHFSGCHQWCLAQGVQQAVIDSMYKTMIEHEPQRKYPMDMTQQIMEHSTDISSDRSEDSNVLTDHDHDSVDKWEIEVQKSYVQSEPYLYKELVEKVRLVIKMITESRSYKTALHSIANRDIFLQLDNHKTWTSMVDMIGSFLKTKEFISKFLKDINSSFCFTKDEIVCLKDIHINLDLVKLVIFSLCRPEANLFTADTALKCLLIQLEARNTVLSLKLAANLRRHIRERRLLIAGVLHYLHEIRSFKAFPNDTTFVKPTSKQITDTVVTLLRQLKFEIPTRTSETVHKDVSSTSKTENANNKNQGHKKEIQLEGKTKDQPEKSRRFDIRRVVNAEKKTYEEKGVRGIYLSKAYEYLLNVKPTIVQPERLFCISRRVTSKIKSFHSDKMLETLIFLRSHFQEERYENFCSD